MRKWHLELIFRGYVQAVLWSWISARIYHHLRLPLGDLKLRGSGRDPFNFGNCNFERLLAPKNSWWVQGATVNPSFQKPDNLNKSLHQLGSIVILVSHEIPLKPDQFVVTPCLDDLWFTWFKNGGFVSIPTLKKSQSVNREIIPGRCVFNQNYSLKATLTIIIGVSWNFWATPKSSQYPMDFD